MSTEVFMGNTIPTDGAGNVFTPAQSQLNGGVIVTDNSAGLAETCSAIIGFKSVLPSSTITGASEDASYPFSNCLDFRDNTQYSPAASSGQVVINFKQAANVEIDYIGIGIHNGKTAEFVATFEVKVAGVWEAVANLTPLGDNKTMIAYIGDKTTNEQRLTINFTSKLFIGCIYVGKAWVFDKTPNLGFTPALTNSLDKLVGFESDTNQFMMGRRVERGFGQVGQFDFINWSGDNSFSNLYVEYMNHCKSGKPLFMKWNKDLQQNFFGRHNNPNNMQPPAYTTNTQGTFFFDFKGRD